MVANKKWSSGWIVVASMLGTMSGCGEPASVHAEYARTVLELAPPGHNARLVSTDFPLSWYPGEKRAVRVTLQNTGAASPADDWNTGTHYMKSQNIPGSLWGVVSMSLPAATPVGASADIYFRAKAPSADPSAIFSSRLFANFPDSASDGFFGEIVSIEEVNVDAANPRMWDCALVAHTLPEEMWAGEVRSVSITVQNTGTARWEPGEVCLRSADSSVLRWGPAYCPGLDSWVDGGDRHTFVFNIKAPSDQFDRLAFRRQMFGIGGPRTPSGIGYFDDAVPCLAAEITVRPSAAYDSAVVSEDFPRIMVADQQAQVTVRLRNAGTLAWPTSFALASLNSPTGAWSTVGSYIPAETASAAEVAISFRIVAPRQVGAYAHRWRMQGFGAIGFFGASLDIPVEVVAFCGNRRVEVPETCDDGNTNAGDGCDASCQVEPTVIDLAVSPASRVFVGNRLDSVAIAEDLNGDGVRDLVAGQEYSLTAGGVIRTVYAGAVIGYAGSPSFFSTVSTLMPTGAFFWISGGEREDFFGSGQDGRIHSGRLFPGENALVVSATGADGEGNSRLGAGEVYLFRASQLDGFIDLAATPNAAAARIIGPEAGAAIRVLDVADVNGDGLEDLLIGAPNASPLARSAAGEVYLLAGGPGLAGTLDLSSVAAPLLLARFIGANAGDRLGRTAALGDFQADSSIDIVLGAPQYGAIALRAGAAYSVIGPLTGTFDLAVDFDSRWLGADRTAALGANVAIANILGTTRADVIVTGTQILNPAVGTGSQRGALGVLEGPVASGSFLVGKVTGYAPFSSMVFGEDPEDDLGSSLAVGNINRDSFSDVFVGAYAADGPGNTRYNTGAAYLLVGRTSFPAVFDLAASTPPEYTIHGPTSSQMLGRFRQGLAVGDLDNAGGEDFCATHGNAASTAYCFRSIH